MVSKPHHGIPVETETARSIKENVFRPLLVPPMMILLPWCKIPFTSSGGSRRAIRANEQRHIVEIGDLPCLLRLDKRPAIPLLYQ